MIHKQTLKTVLIIIFVLILFFVFGNITYANEPSVVDLYGCNSLYTSDDPNILADYMSELIGHQPMKTTLESFVAELPCENIDIGRIVFNVCGVTGDEHVVCESWKLSYPHLYSDEFYYQFYANTLQAALPRQQVVGMHKEQVMVEETDVETYQEPRSGLNLVHILFLALVLCGGGYVMYNRAMRQSVPDIQEIN